MGGGQGRVGRKGHTSKRTEIWTITGVNAGLETFPTVFPAHRGQRWDLQDKLASLLIQTGEVCIQEQKYAHR